MQQLHDLGPVARRVELLTSERVVIWLSVRATAKILIRMEFIGAHSPWRQPGDALSVTPTPPAVERCPLIKSQF